MNKTIEHWSSIKPYFITSNSSRNFILKVLQEAKEDILEQNEKIIELEKQLVMR